MGDSIHFPHFMQRRKKIKKLEGQFAITAHNSPPPPNPPPKNPPMPAAPFPKGIPSNLLKPAQVRQPIPLHLRHHIRLPLPQHIHITLELAADPQHGLEMPLPHGLLLLLRDQQRRAHAVADLAPVERLPAPRGGGVALQVLQLRRGQVLRAGEFVEEEHPDLGAARLVEDGQAEGDVDAGLEGLVEGADAVGREEEDAVEVLERAEEDFSRFHVSDFFCAA